MLKPAWTFSAVGISLRRRADLQVSIQRSKVPSWSSPDLVYHGPDGVSGTTRSRNNTSPIVDCKDMQAIPATKVAIAAGHRRELGMRHKDARARKEATAEGLKRDALTEQQLRKWKCGAVWLGLALVVSVGLVVPFSAGHSLHRYAGGVGKFLVYLSMCLLSVFIYAAATTYNLWSYRRAMKKIHNRTAPPPARTVQR